MLTPPAPRDLVLQVATTADPAATAVPVLTELAAAVAGLDQESDPIAVTRTSVSAFAVDRFEACRRPLWRVVQAHPSAVTFPGPEGESMLAMQLRAVEAVRAHDAAVAEQHGEDAVWAAVSHGDVIKAVLADALGMHLDAFQRLVVDPCSVSAVRYTPLRPFALRVNDTGGDLSDLVPRPRARRRGGRRKAAAGGGAASDAVVGGGPGTA